jgi:predicted anti-sigma-YlaC factor YlaD
MIQCKEVAALLSTDQLLSQSAWRRLAVRVHLMMCRHCRRFARQLALLQQMALELGARFDAEAGSGFTRRVQNRLAL